MKLFKLASVMVLLCGAAFAQLQCPTFPCTVQVTATQCPSGLPCAVTITQTPPPAVVISPAAISFTAALNTDSPIEIVLVSNGGASTVPLSWAFAGAGFVDGGVTTCKNAQITHGKCGISVKFHPTTAGAVTGTLTVNAGTPSVATMVSMSGATINPPPPVSMTVSPATLNLGAPAVGGVSIPFYSTVTNTGSAPLILSGWTGLPSDPDATGHAPIGFSVNALGSCKVGVAIAPAGNCTLGFKYKPAALGVVAGSMSVASNASNSPATILLTGGAVVKNVQLNWGASPPAGTVCNSATPPVCNVAAVSYNLYRATGSGTLVKVGNVVGSVLTFTDAAVPSGNYQYAARALDAAGDESVNSNLVSVTIP